MTPRWTFTPSHGTESLVSAQETLAECEINQSPATHTQTDNAQGGVFYYLVKLQRGREVDPALLFKEKGEHGQLLSLSRVHTMLRIVKTFSVAACGHDLGLGRSASWLLPSIRWPPLEQSCCLGETAGLASAPAKGREPIPLMCTVASRPGTHSWLSCQRTILDPTELAGVPGAPVSLCLCVWAAVTCLFPSGFSKRMEEINGYKGLRPSSYDFTYAWFWQVVSLLRNGMFLIFWPKGFSLFWKVIRSLLPEKSNVWSVLAKIWPKRPVIPTEPLRLSLGVFPQ